MADSTIQTNISGQVHGIAGAGTVHIENVTIYGRTVEEPAPPLADPGPIPPCPYPGLAYFGPDEADLFFGRDTAIERLSRAVGRQGLTALVGASGTGKSSIVLAGLAPHLHRTGDWLFSYFRVGAELDRDPFRALARALVPFYVASGDDTERLKNTKALADSLQAGDLALRDVFADCRMRNKGKRILLIADQFEETFTLVEDEVSRRRFIDLLLAGFPDPARDTASDIGLILTLRADFYGHALRHRPLADALQEHVENLGPMNRDELHKAVVCPAEKRRVSFEPGLVQTLLDDVEGKPGSLPLLQFALREMWGRQENRTVTRQSYDAIGGVEGALAQRAETIFGKLTGGGADERTVKTFQRLFTRLVTLGEGQEDTRRVVERRELGDEVWQLAQHLAGEENRLVVTNAPAQGRETAEVVHEALIRHWPKLVDWIDKDRTFQAWLRRIHGNVALWLKEPGDDGPLLRGGMLAQAADWLAKRRDDLSPEERDFVEAGIALHRCEEEAKEAVRRTELTREQERADIAAKLADEQRRRARGARMFGFAASAVAAIAFVLVLALIGVSVEAKRRSQEAEQRKQDAERSYAAALDTGDRIVEAVNEQQKRGQLRGRAAENLLQLVSTGYGKLQEVRDAPELAYQQAQLLKRVAEVERGMDRSKIASESMEVALGITRQLRDRDSGNSKWQRRVAAYTVISAKFLIDLGRGEVARERLAEAEAIYARFNPGPPRDADWAEVSLVISQLRAQVSLSMMSDRAAHYAVSKGRIQILEGLLKHKPSHKTSLATACIAASQEALMLGLPSEAGLFTSQADELISEGLRDTPDSAEWLRIKASRHDNAARAAKLNGDYEEALRLNRETVGLKQRISERDPENRDDRLALTSARVTTADTLKLLGRLDEAIGEAGQTVEILEKLAADSPDNVWVQRDLRDAYFSRGLIWADRRSFDAARADIERAASTNQTVLRLAPDDDLALGLVVHHGSTVSLSYLNEGKFAEAEPAARAYVEAARVYAERRPDDRERAKRFCDAQGHLTFAMRPTRPQDDEGLLQQYRAEEACYAPFLAASPNDGSLLDNFRRIQVGIAATLRSRGDAAGALQAAAAAAALDRRRCGSAEDANRQGERAASAYGPGDRAIRQVMVAGACAEAAEAARDTGDLAGAAGLYRRAVAHAAEWVAKNPDAVAGRNTLARSQSALVAVLRTDRRTEEAEAEARTAVDRWGELSDVALALLRRDGASAQMAEGFLLGLYSLTKELKAAGRPDEALARLAAAQAEIARLRERRLLREDGENVVNALTKLQSDLVQLR